MKTFILLLTIVMSLAAFAGDRLEAWQRGKEIKFVERDSQGQFVRTGLMQLEHWDNTDDRSEWVARHKDGTFVTGYKGYVEKFKVDGKSREENRLVIRNNKGQFVTWLALDEMITAKFEARDTDRDGKKETVYVIRFNGRLLNWAKAKLETWKNYKNPVLVVRDTEDSVNNGKLLAWIVGKTANNGQVLYRDPDTGRFVSVNK